MYNKQKKIKKKYDNSKLHFIIFQTSKKPINISISKWLVYCSSSFLLITFLFVFAFSYHTHVSNANLNDNLSTIERELQQLQIDKLKLDVENSNLKASLDEKTVKITGALSELENLQGSIKEIKKIVGLPVEENKTAAPIPAIKIPATPPGSRGNGVSRGKVLIIRNEEQTSNKSDVIIDDNFNDIESLIEQTKIELEELQINVEDRKQYLEDTPILFPTNGKITSPFGSRWGGFHRGIDISNSIGTKVYVSGNGVVIESKFGYSYGNYILVKHKNGFETRYAHLSKRLVKVGTELKQGDLIGLMGNTGTSYGSHLHYEIRYNKGLINPLKIEDYLKYKE